MIDSVHLVDVWATALWRASWQGGLVALAVWCVCRLAPSIPARFQAWLWRLVVVKFLVALVWSAPLEVPLLPESPPTASSPATWEPSLPAQQNSLATGNGSVVEPRVSRALSPWLIPFLVWTAFVGWQAARIVAACRHARRLRNACRPCENKYLIEELARLSTSAGLGSPPTLLETDGQGSPLLLGIFRPAIVLPSTTLNRLSDSERALVIGHELAHLRRADLLWSVVAAVTRSLFFFHPLAWLAERRLRLTQEIAADELAIALERHDPVSYATVLVSVIDKLGPARRLPAMSVGMAGSQQSLKQRFSAMRFMKPVSRRVAVAYGIALGLVAVPAIVPWAVVAADPPATDKPRTADQPRTADKPRPADKPRTADKPLTADQAEPKDGATFNGKFVSFKGGVLKINIQDNKTDVWTESGWKVAENTKVVSHINGTAKEGVAGEAFKQREPGAMISVTTNDGKVTFVEIGGKPAAIKVPDRAPEKAAEKVGQKRRMEWGKFVSFQDGVLTLKANSGSLIEHKIPANAKASVWDNAADIYQPKGAAEAFHETKEGTWVYVSEGAKPIYIGTRKGQSVGTFVSFKNDRLLLLGKNLGEGFTKKYGNNLHFNKFADNVPVYESIDGGEYRLIGTANKSLGNVKEGTLVTVHAEGDDNITFIQIGVPKQQ